MSDLDNYTKLLQEQSVTTRGARPMNLSYKPKPTSLLCSIHFPGWYRDADGGLCVLYKDHLVSIRFDDVRSQYHVCADILSPSGLWDKNIRWEATYDIEEAKSYALSIIKELSAVGEIK